MSWSFAILFPDVRLYEPTIVDSKQRIALGYRPAIAGTAFIFNARLQSSELEEWAHCQESEKYFKILR